MSRAINFCLDIFDDDLVVRMLKFHILGQVLLIRGLLNVQQYLNMLYYLVYNHDPNLAPYLSKNEMNFC